MSFGKISAIALMGVMIGSGVQAQSMSTASAGFETGYGRARGAEERAINPSTRDANGNRLMLDGVIVTGSDNSVYSQSRTYGAGDSIPAQGRWGATAIGNYLSVVVQGNYNTVIIDSTQINNGDITATNKNQTATAGAETDITGSLNGF